VTASPFATMILFRLGPVPITTAVVMTWGIMAALTIGSWLATRSLALNPSLRQATIEFVIGAIEDQIRETLRVEPRPYLPLIGTLFLFILAANWSAVIPGVEPPTRYVETDAALALVVLMAVVFYGVRTRGLLGYLGTFAEPMIFMVPLNVIETFTRTFSLIVRLFGNVMSGVFIIGIVLSLAGLIVPIPLMALHLLTGAIQAYIFTVLATVFIGGAVTSPEQANERGKL
jgi:F-type H+-transporting ATPase subunit a